MCNDENVTFSECLCIIFGREMQIEAYGDCNLIVDWTVKKSVILALYIHACFLAVFVLAYSQDCLVWRHYDGKWLIMTCEYF